MTNKLVVIINNLKEPKIKKILLYEMKFLVPNYNCLQKPWLGGYRPLCPLCPLSWTEFVESSPPPPKKIPGYGTSHNLVLLGIMSTIIKISLDNNEIESDINTNYVLKYSFEL